jgi:hypothetical protein
MFEKISDLFNDVKDKLSSPFISSFIIAWCLWNWRFALAVLLYKQENLPLDGYVSYIDVFNKTTDMFTKYIFPSLAALLYTFVYPAFKNLVLWSQAAYKKAGMKKVLEVSDTAHVTVSRYVKLRDQYQQSIKDFANSISQDRDIANLNDELREQVTRYKEESNANYEEIEKLRSWHSVSFLDGEWTLHIIKNESSTPVDKDLEPIKVGRPQQIQIQNGVIDYDETAYEFDNYEKLRIMKFMFNGRLMYLRLRASYIDNINWVLEQELSDRSRYVGSSSLNERISLVKIDK